MSAEEDSQKGIRWLDVDDLIQINRFQIETFTPLEPIGVRDENGLCSAQNSPSVYKYYEQCNDLMMLAAVLGSRVAKAHAFLNANKRTAFHAVAAFLLLNGQELTAPEDDVVSTMVALVKNEISENEFADWLAYWSRPFDTSNLNNCTAR